MTVVPAARARLHTGDLHFPARGIECDSGVKQYGDASTPPKRLSRLGRQTAGETLCLAPNCYASELPSARKARRQSLLAVYVSKQRKVHQVTKFSPNTHQAQMRNLLGAGSRDVVWTSRL